MGLNVKKWIKGATRVRFDDRTLANLTKNVATGAGAALGGPLGMAIAGGGSALGTAMGPGSNIGDILTSGVKGAGTAGAIRGGAKLAGGFGGKLRDDAGAIVQRMRDGSGGGGEGGGASGGGTGGGMPGMTPLKAGAGGVPASVVSDPSRFRKIADGAKKFLPNSVDDWLDVGRFVGDTYGGYKEGQREDDLYNRDRDEYNRRAPLRAAGMAGLLDQSRPDLSSTFQVPEQRYRKISIGSRS